MKEGLTRQMVGLESYINAEAQEYVAKVLATTKKPTIFWAEHWANVGVVEFTAAFLDRAPEIEPVEVINVLIRALTREAERDLEFTSKLIDHHGRTDKDPLLQATFSRIETSSQKLIELRRLMRKVPSRPEVDLERAISS